MFPVWLASHSDCVRSRAQQRNRQYVNADACTTFVVSELAAERPSVSVASLHGNYIVGVVLMSITAVYDDMTVMSRQEREQYSFWQEILSSELHGRFFCFTISEAVALTQADPVQRCSARALRSFVIDLETGQPDRLHRTLVAEGRSPPWLAVDGILPQVALRAPAAHAQLAVWGCWRALWLPHVNDRLSGSAWCMPFAKLGIPEDKLPSPPISSALEPSEISPSLMQEVADALRRSSALTQDHDERQNLRRLTVSLQAYVDESNVAGLARHIPNLGKLEMEVGDGCQRASKRLAYKSAFLIHVLIMSGLIMHDANLRQVLAGAFGLMLPPSLAAPLVRAVEDAKAIPLPHKSTISRWRMLLDSAFMMWTRVRLQQEHVHFGMVDSSTQGGKDYVLVVIASILKADLPALVERADDLAFMHKNRTEIDEALRDIDKEQSIMDFIAKRIVLHRPPPVMLASGRTRLFDKFLETGSPDALRAFLQGLLVLTTDLGVEFNLATVRPMEANVLFPYASFANLGGQEFSAEVVDFDDGGDPSALVGFTDSLSIPGVLHIIHNASNELLDSMPSVSEAIDRLALVPKMLNDRATCLRLCQTCFTSALASTIIKLCCPSTGPCTARVGGPSRFA